MRKEIIICGCGCGTTLDKYDNRGRERKYIYKHLYKIQHSKQFKCKRIPWNKGKVGLQVSWNKGNIGYLAGKNSPHYKGGKPQCACGKELSTYKAIKCRKCNLKSLNYKEIGLKGLIKQQNMKEPTSIEKTLYDYLLLKGILFERQKLINGKFIVDAYIPSLNLVIEADGKYWHTLDRVVKKDKAENAYLRKCGFNLMRLTDTEINSGKFKERLVV